jgi:hypothetical protein
MAEETSLSFNKFFTLVIVSAFMASSACATAADKSAERRFKAVLDARMASVTPPGVGSDPKKVNQLFEAVDALGHLGREADGVLVDLFDYYLGEGSGEDLANLIIQRGYRMIPALTERKRQPLKCLPEYESICRENVGNRNAVIDSVIDGIKSKNR